MHLQQIGDNNVSEKQKVKNTQFTYTIKHDLFLCCRGQPDHPLRCVSFL